MKFLKSFFCATLVTLSIPVIASPECKGDAYIPTWQKHFGSSYQYTHLLLSNISDVEIGVQVELYDQNGNLYEEISESGTNINLDPIWTGDPIEPSTAILAANSTAYIIFPATGAAKYGYGIVHWESYDPACKTKSMLASYISRINIGSTRLSESQTNINGGLPF